MKKPVRRRARGYFGITQPSYSKLAKHFKANVIRRLTGGHSKVLIRFGYSEDFPVENANGYIEINSKEAINICKNKLLTKEVLKELNIPTPKWNLITDDLDDINLLYPVYSKTFYGSKGRGMYLIENEDQLKNHIEKYSSQSNRLLEERCKYVREYGIHVSSKSGIFHAVRKMIKEDSTERWYRNSNNCVFFLEDNENFNKPLCWDELEENLLRFMDKIKLDIGRFDVKVSSSGEKFKVLEVNSAPSLQGEVVFRKYVKELNKVIELCAE